MVVNGAGNDTVRIGVSSVNDPATNFVGDGVSGILIWGADLRYTVYDLLSLPPYQRVGDGSPNVFDYDPEVGGVRFPVWLERGAANRGLTTLGLLDLTGTDAVVEGMLALKTSDAATQILQELSASVATNNGSVYIAIAPTSLNVGNVGAAGRGTLVAVAGANGHPTPGVLAALHSNKISTDTNQLFINGQLFGSSNADQGTGAMGLHGVNQGGRGLGSGSPSLSFTGRWLPGFIADANAVDATLAAELLREIAATVAHNY